MLPQPEQSPTEELLHSLESLGTKSQVLRRRCEPLSFRVFRIMFHFRFNIGSVRYHFFATVTPRHVHRQYRQMFTFIICFASFFNPSIT